MSSVAKRYDNIEKSPEDKRLYRGLEMSNGIKALLVSDPTTDKSAAAVDVNIGFMSDPDEIPGLAHFCEHMLFLGTEKYPEENTYSQFLATHGGASNACTSSDHTTYYFDVLPEHLGEALDIFAQFFISPLFTPECTGRELLAVNSEHDKNIRVDHWRIDQLNRLVADQTHPHSKFGTGNKETLEANPKKLGLDVHKELLKFHKKWYSSNIMTMVLFGKESLDDLEKMAVENFSSVANLNVTAPSFDSPFLPEHLGLIMNIVPVKDLRLLYIDFPIPDYTDYYLSGPVHYISHLIGHEGPGSLLSLLKSKGWCNSLSCGPHIGVKGYDVLNVTVEMTEDGINHVDDIVELVFQYINLVKKEGIQPWIFEEIRSVWDTNFRFKNKEEPRSFVVAHVSNIQQYAMEHVVKSYYKLTEWRPDLIEMFLTKLNPNNIRVAVMSRCFKSVCDQTEKWYGTNYHLEKIPETTLKRWDESGLCKDFVLPLPNTFIPDNFDMIPLDSESKDYPKIIYDSPTIRLWYKQDDEYFLPKLICYFDFFNPLAYSDPLNTSLNALFAMLVNDDLTEYTYAAELAGLYYTVVNSRIGLSISLTGFNSKQHILLKRLIEKIVNFKVKADRFPIYKEMYLREMRNFEMTPPYQHGTFHLSMALTERAWSKKEFIDTADDLTIENLQEFVGNYFSKVYVESFIYGNASKNKALELMSIVRDGLPKNIIPLLPQQLLTEREIQLEKGCHYKIEVDHTVHSDSCALVYLQCGLDCTSLNVKLELILQILNEPCFNILRTKEQLGYMVFSGIRCSYGVRGMRILVQSEKHPQYVESRIEAFLNYMTSYIENISADEFEKHRQSLIAEKLKRPKMMTGLGYKMKHEISSQQYHFDRVNVEVGALRQVTKQQIVDYYKDVIAITSKDRQKLVIHVVSSAEGGAGKSDNKSDYQLLPDVEYLPVPEDGSKVKLVTDLITLKSGCALFPLVAPYTNIPRKGAHCKL